jgi:hypothetical protein
VLHCIEVPGDWLARGETIEFTVPRNLTCASCEGGGCDACDRAGAVSLRGRKDPAQTVQVSLPEKGLSNAQAQGQSLVLRIPEQGGVSAAEDIPRGLLMLKVKVADAPGPSVALCRASASPAPEATSQSLRAPRSVVMRSLVLALLLSLVFLWMLHLSGWL